MINKVLKRTCSRGDGVLSVLQKRGKSKELNSSRTFSKQSLERQTG
jgi:hypothetical protein